MHKFTKIVMAILSSSIVLYLVGVFVFFLAVDQPKVDIKILNYLRGSVRHVWAYSEGQEEYDELKFLDAIEYYQRILKTMSFQQLTHGALGYCQYVFGEKGKAIKSFQAAIKENPKFFGYYYNLGIIYFEEGKWNKAIEMFQRAVEVRLDTMIGYYSTISTKLFSEKVIAEEWTKRKALASKDAYEDALRMMVLSYDRRGDHESVFSMAAHSLKMVDDDDGFFQFSAGKAALALQKYEIAFQLFDQVLKVDPANAQVFEYQSMIAEKMGNQTAARMFLERAKNLKKKNYSIKRKPIYFVPLYELGG